MLVDPITLIGLMVFVGIIFTLAIVDVCDDHWK